MAQPGTGRARRQPRDMERKGPNAILAENIPVTWAGYFANDDWNPDDDGDEAWSRKRADAWAEDYARKGYVFSGDDTTREPEPDTFNGLWGPQQRVHLVNQAVLEADRAARRFTVSGTDELPTEYVLTLGHDAAIVLPECFAPRIEDPEADPEDPGSAETPRSSGWGRAGAAIGGGSDEENPERLDGLWTAAAADRALQWLADHGWEVECLLTGTEHDGWYRRCWGRVAFYLARKVEPAGDQYAPVFHEGGPAHWPGDKGAWPHLGTRR